MPPRMNMQISSQSRNPYHYWNSNGVYVAGLAQAYKASFHQSTLGAGGTMRMINRVRFAKAGCSSCGGK